jgi:hypothetical protein
MTSVAEFFSHPLAMFGLGLFVGLWVAVNVWILRWSVGYKAGIAFCTRELEPLRLEFAGMTSNAHAARFEDLDPMQPYERGKPH